ncbi:MAG: hypothetical protein PsegKO_33980 [Pseudohongiellaceae bacterium]|jgi:peptidyl-prolyl cis-trans isomerase A (cyclophilin A)
MTIRKTSDHFCRSWHPTERGFLSSFLASFLPSFLILPLVLFTASAQGGTRVLVQSNLGEFTLELYDDEVPATVAQFLANLEAGTYQFTMLHFASPTLLAGGLFFYNSCSAGPVLAPTIATAPVESGQRQNSTRTIAMVPTTEDPGAIGSQWVINLGNNDSLYEPALRPIVFGEIVEGFSTADSIADLWRVPMNISPSVPTINYFGIEVVQCGLFNADNVVKAAMQVEPPGADAAANTFEPESGLLTIKVNAGAAGLLQVSLQLQTAAPIPVLQVQPETVTPLLEAVDGMAQFDDGTGELLIPELSVAGEIAYRDLRLRLTDAENLFFTLLSAENP